MANSAMVVEYSEEILVKGKECSELFKKAVIKEEYCPLVKAYLGGWNAAFELIKTTRRKYSMYRVPDAPPDVPTNAVVIWQCGWTNIGCLESVPDDLFEEMEKLENGTGIL
jgi:hypothetical protein